MNDYTREKTRAVIKIRNETVQDRKQGLLQRKESYQRLKEKRN